MMSHSAVILGKVVDVRPRTGLPAATLLPIAEVSPDGLQWSPPYDETTRQELFPNAGRISWIEPPAQAVSGTYWVFQTEFQPSYDKDPDDPHRDKYRVIREQPGRTWYGPAREVIDVDSLGGEPIGRERVTRTGIPLETNSQPALHLKWGSLVTPTPLRFQKLDTGLWVVEPAECKPSMEWRELPTLDGILECPDGSKKFFLVPDFAASGVRVTRDWASDEEVLKHVLARLRKWDPEFCNTLEITGKAIARMTSILPASATDAQSLEFHRHRIERVKNHLERAKTEQELIERARAVLAYGPLADAVEKEKSELLVVVRREAEKAIEAELAGRKNEADSIAITIEDKKAELEGLEAQLEDRRNALLTRVEELEAEIESRIRKASERPATLLADVALARVFARVHQPSVDASRTASESTGDDTQTFPLVTAEREALAALEKSFVVHEVPTALLRPLHASFLAGAFPLLAGPRGYDTLKAYSQAVCAGEVHWVPISPGCLDLLDLFGRVDHTSGRFVPTAGNLAGFLDRVRTRDSLHLVVLDGATRAGVDSYLLPLLDCVFDEMRGVNSRELGLLPTEVRTVDGRDTGLSKFRWPSNVLLAGIVRQGVSSFTPPSELWSRATFFMPDLCVQSTSRPDSIHPDAWAVQRRSLPVTRVPRNVWSEWQRQRQSVTLTDYAQFWSAPNAPQVDRVMRELFLRIFAACSGCTDDPKVALGNAVSASLLPLLRTSPDAIAALWDTAGCLYPDARLACQKAVEWLG